MVHSLTFVLQRRLLFSCTRRFFAVSTNIYFFASLLRFLLFFLLSLVTLPGALGVELTLNSFNLCHLLWQLAVVLFNRFAISVHFRARLERNLTSISSSSADHLFTVHLLGELELFCYIKSIRESCKRLQVYHYVRTSCFLCFSFKEDASETPLFFSLSVRYKRKYARHDMGGW